MIKTVKISENSKDSIKFTKNDKWANVKCHKTFIRNDPICSP